jgi:serine/threonine protein phosphatase PrpC
MKLQYAGETNVGMKREHNEDNLLVFAEQNLFVVADGIGGHNCGEVASQIAVDTMKAFFNDTSKDDEVTWPYKIDKNTGYDENRMTAGVKLANRNIFETGKSDPRFDKMGTTLVGAFWSKEKVVVAHVGDSRCYRVHKGKLIQVTEDHTLLNDYKKLQALTEEEEAAFQYKNVIVRALGMKDSVLVDINHVTPEPGDIFLLCSDGLHGEVTDPNILATIEKHRDDLSAGVKSLIKQACDNGGKDNVTVVLVRYDGK